MFGDQGHLAVVVNEADARQPLVRDTLREAERVEVAKIDALLRQPFVKFHHQRLVFRANRTERHTQAVARFHRKDVIRGIGADGETLGGGALGPGDLNPGIQRDHTVGIGEQWIDIELCDLGKVDRDLGHTHKRERNRLEIGGGHAPITLQ